MMLPQCSHITRKRGVYYYRRRFPMPFAGEIALSLRTSNYRAAEHAAQNLNRRFEEFFAVSPMPCFDPQATLRAYLQKHLTALREKHLLTPHRQPVHLAAGPGRDQEADLAGIDHQLRQLRSDIRHRDVRPVANIVEQLASDAALTEAARVELGLGVLQVHVQLLEQSRKWLTEGLVAPIDLSEPAEPTVAPPVVPALAPTSVSEVAAPKLSELLPDFLDLMVEAQGWKGQTLAQNNATYRMLIEWCGDRPVTEYKKRDLAGFYDMLRKLPKLYSKSKEWRDLTLCEVIERSQGLDIERLTMTTIKRHFAALGRLFTYLKKRDEYIGENPAHGFEFPKKGRARDKRQVWSDEQLVQLFKSPIWAGCLSESKRAKPGSLVIRDEKFWLPLLSIFHGNRLEEFAQLRRSDVRREGDIWYFDINDDGVKQLKNEQSKRRVPVHSKTVQLGFLTYVEDVAPKPDDLVFPQLRPGGPDNKLGYYFTKWWTRYRRDIGLYEKGLDYHSFRHTVTNKLAAAEISVDVRNEIFGREGQSIDQSVYLKGLPLRMLADAIGKVQWPELEEVLASLINTTEVLGGHST